MGSSQNVVAFERSQNTTSMTSHGQSWGNVVRNNGFTYVMEADSGHQDPLCGLKPSDIEQLATNRAIEIRSNPGGHRAALAKRLHRSQGSKEAALISLDLAQHGSTVSLDEQLKEIMSAREQAGDIRESTLFVDNVQFLEGQLADTLQAMINASISGAAAPRVILGSLKDTESLLTGAETVTVAPLAERGDDVASEATRRFATVRNAPHLSEEALTALRDWTWPGEEQELTLALDRLQLEFAGRSVSAEAMTQLLKSGHELAKASMSLATIEEEHIYRVLNAQGWNRTRTAKTLGIDVKTLYNKLRRYESKRRLPQRQD